MNTDPKPKVDGVLSELPPETEEWLKQAQNQLQADAASLATLPRRYTRETGMEDPDLDISPEPYEPKK